MTAVKEGKVPTYAGNLRKEWTEFATFSTELKRKTEKDVTTEVGKKHNKKQLSAIWKIDYPESFNIKKFSDLYDPTFSEDEKTSGNGLCAGEAGKTSEQHTNSESTGASKVNKIYVQREDVLESDEDDISIARTQSSEHVYEILTCSPSSPRKKSSEEFDICEENTKCSPLNTVEEKTKNSAFKGAADKAVDEDAGKPNVTKTEKDSSMIVAHENNKVTKELENLEKLVFKGAAHKAVDEDAGKPNMKKTEKVSKEKKSGVVARSIHWVSSNWQGIAVGFTTAIAIKRFL